MAREFDRSKSLQQLEHHDWGEPTFDSHLVRACHQLRRKPLIDFTVEDLRIMIGQKISLPYLVPIALERLEVDPLIEGHYYRGDLLGAVLSIGDSFWSARPDLADRVQEIVKRVRAALPDLDEITTETVLGMLRDGNASLK